MTEAIIKRVLDTVRSNRNVDIISVTNDHGARFIEAVIAVDGKPILIDLGCAVTIEAKRYDGASKAFPGSVNENGTVKVPITQWMLEIPNTGVDATISVTTTKPSKLSTTNFTINVQDSPHKGEEISPDDPEYDVFVQVLAGEAERVAAEKARADAEAARVEAENTRFINEEEREMHELVIRMANEQARVANENARITAEKTREAAEQIRQQNEAERENQKQLSSNALKGKKSGGIVAMSDISPFQNTLDVSVTGAVKVKKLGKNLIPFPYKSLRGVLGKGTSDTHNGITYIVNDDGSVTMNGTATDASIFYLNSSAYSWKLQPGKYALDVVKNSLYYYSISFKDDVTGSTTEIQNNYEHKGRVIERSNETTVSTFRIAIARGITVNNLTVYPQLELGFFPTEYEPYIEPIEYDVNEDGTVEGVLPIYPSTTLMTDTSGAVIDVEYNRDINKAFAELYNAIISLGGNV